MSLLSRLNETFTTKAIDKLPLRPLDAATPDFNPRSPDKNRITRTCIGIGFLVFFGVAVGLSFLWWSGRIVDRASQDRGR